jgi:hypothetical protein
MEALPPKVRIVNGSIVIDGIFKFNLSYTKYGPDSQPVKMISFPWSPEIPQNINQMMGEHVIIEMLAQKLKEDFIYYANNILPKQ